MDLTDEQRSDLQALIRAKGYDRSVSARAQLVLLHADGHSIKTVAQMGRTTRPTVYKWLDRYERFGPDGLVNVPPPGRPREVGDDVRAQIVALTRTTPPAETGLSHWSSRELAKYLKRAKGHLGLPQLRLRRLARARPGPAPRRHLQAVARPGFRGQGL